ncbi:phosphotransferase family protein [Subtercola boreus]|uniref:Phosphotransferase family protein n=1 Tax=Subtercola boreus TaxID=120213 RepID=A0A3E0VF15_9MICO|nr:phosphotransferase family protein [Subtercola boreus]RFA08524.1 phosphotransferase family protein [Subtercola boreus]TQL54548.1 aminoglycoside phosphotransferase (APT) family kinase protein [Subtercola boreus]
MTTTPDGTEVVASRAEALQLPSPPLLIVDSVTQFLDDNALGDGPIDWQRIGDGQSNITYRIDRGAETFILRRGPRPPLPRSTHDMLREARIQHLVGERGIPVPRILASTGDESILGVPFYVMSFLDGEVITDEIPVMLDTLEQRRATSVAIVESLVALHSVDVTTGPLAAFGRPDGYLARQVERFASLWGVTSKRTLPAVAELGDWLRGTVPDSQRASVVHGDYRAGNLMFASRAPAEVTAILDWEMATLGDPLADLGYLTATYAEPGVEPTPLELTPVTREAGYLRRDEIAALYEQRMKVDLGDLRWYQALALWKAAIFCEAMYTRWLDGERPGDTFGPTLETGVPRLLEGAREFAGIGSSRTS